MNEDLRWARNNFGFQSTDEIQREKVDVYFPPNVGLNRKVVDLSDGHMEFFTPAHHLPREGLYADFASLQAYCLRQGCPLVETEGYAIPQGVGRGEAGHPLRHEGH